MKKILIVLVVTLLMSCGGEGGEKALLDPYIAIHGQPTTTKEETLGNVVFVTYVWNSNKGQAKLVLSKSKGKWEEVRFSSY